MIKLAIVHGYRNVGDAIAHRIGGDETKARPVTTLDVAEGIVHPLDLSTCIAISAWHVPTPWPGFADARAWLDNVGYASEDPPSVDAIRSALDAAEIEISRLSVRPAAVSAALAALACEPEHSYTGDAFDFHSERCARCDALERLALASQ